MFARRRLNVTLYVHCLTCLDFPVHRYWVLGLGCNFYPLYAGLSDQVLMQSARQLLFSAVHVETIKETPGTYG